MHFDAAPSLAVRTLLAGAAGRHLHVAPCEGFAAHALLGAQLRRRSAAPLAARLLHTAPPDRTSSQQQQHGKGDGADLPLRDLHTSALAAAKDDPAAPPREVREAAGCTCAWSGACGALVSPLLTRACPPPGRVGCRPQVDIDDLTEARAEAARVVKSAQGVEVGRVQEATQMTKTVAAWIASVPAKMGGLARMSRAEWQTMLSGFWVAIKKEAHHFWVSRTRRAQLHIPVLSPVFAAQQVGSKLLYAEVQISMRLIGGVLRGNPLSRCVPPRHAACGACPLTLVHQARAQAVDAHHGRHVPAGAAPCHCGACVVRFGSRHAIESLHTANSSGCPLYGACAARAAEALPEHASLNLSGQAEA